MTRKIRRYTKEEIVGYARRLLQKITIFDDHFTEEFKSGLSVNIRIKRASHPDGLIRRVACFLFAFEPYFIRQS